MSEIKRRFFEVIEVEQFESVVPEELRKKGIYYFRLYMGRKCECLECVYCSAIPDEFGYRYHGKGCYVVSENGRGSDEPTPCPSCAFKLQILEEHKEINDVIGGGGYENRSL